MKYSWLLRLYPRRWRIRYEDEFLAMLELRNGSLLDLIDIVHGAVDAHHHPQVPDTAQTTFEGIPPMLQTHRRTAILVFCAYIGFFIVGLGFQNMTNDDYFTSVMTYHSELSASYTTMLVSFLLALLAIAVGGIPIAFVAIRQSAKTARKNLLFFTVPLFCLGLLIGGGYFYIAVQNGTITLSTNGANGVYAAYLLLLALCAIASTASVTFAVAHSELDEKVLRFSLIPATIATIAMAVTLGAAIYWGISLNVDAPWVFNATQYLGSYENAIHTNTEVEWLGIVIVMAIATGIAFIAIIRGISQRRGVSVAA